MDYGALELLYLVFAAFATAILHSVGGFAGALLMAVAVAPVLGVKETVPVVATAMMISQPMAKTAQKMVRLISFSMFQTVPVIGCHFQKMRKRIRLVKSTKVLLSMEGAMIFVHCFLNQGRAMMLC